jgi:hypothetical protein
MIENALLRLLLVSALNGRRRGEKNGAKHNAKRRRRRRAAIKYWKIECNKRHAFCAGSMPIFLHYLPARRPPWTCTFAQFISRLLYALVSGDTQPQRNINLSPKQTVICTLMNIDDLFVLSFCVLALSLQAKSGDH